VPCLPVSPRLELGPFDRIYPILICAYARGLETRDSAYAKSGTVNPREYLTPLSGGALITLFKSVRSV
jgi:hypothetical protein